MRITFRSLLYVGALLAPSLAAAQDAALDDKLRDLLRQTTEQLRAAQDSAGTLQAQLDSMTKQRDALQQQLTEAQAKPAVSPTQLAALKQAQQDAAAAHAQLAAQGAGVARLQKAYQDAALLARDKDASGRRNAAGFKKTSAALNACKEENTKLVATAEDILHLYETPQFNRLLIANHDRVIGFARVKLENLVQDYEDKIDVQTYIAPPKP